MIDTRTIHLTICDACEEDDVEDYGIFDSRAELDRTFPKRPDWVSSGSYHFHLQCAKDTLADGSLIPAWLRDPAERALAAHEATSTTRDGQQ